MKVKVVTSPNMFDMADGREIKHLDLEEGTKLKDLKPKGWKYLSTYYIVNGKRKYAWQKVRKDDFINIVNKPSGLVTAIVVSYIVVRTVTHYAIKSALKNLDNQPKPDAKDTDIYGFTGITNSKGQGFGMPLLYGEHRVGGVIGGQYARVPNTGAGSSQLDTLILLGEGPMKEIGGITSDTAGLTALDSTMHINGTDASSYSASYSVSMGNLTDAVADWNYPRAFYQTHQAVDVNQPLNIFNERNNQAITGGSTANVEFDDAQNIQTGEVSLYENTSSSSYSGRTFRQTATVSSISSDNKVYFSAPITHSYSTNRCDLFQFYYRECICPTAFSADSVTFNLHFPQGLYILNSAGQRRNSVITFDIEYRNTYLGESNWRSYVKFSQTSKKGGSFWLSKTFDFHVGYDPDTGEVSTAGNAVKLLSDFTTAARIDFRIRRNDRRRFDAEDVNETDSCDIKTVVFSASSDHKKYLPGTAWLEISNLNNIESASNTPNMTVVCKGRTVKKATNATPTLTDAGDSYNNPAWVITDLLTNDGYGAGEFVSNSNIDWQSFIDWATWCDELVIDKKPSQLAGQANAGATEITLSMSSTVGDDTGYEQFSIGDTIYINDGASTAENRVVTGITASSTSPKLHFSGGLSNTHAVNSPVVAKAKRHVFNGVFDKEDSIWKAILGVANVGMATIVKQGEKFKAIPEKEKDSTQLFNESNIKSGTFTHTKLGSDTQDSGVEVAFLNANKNYDKDIARIEDEEAFRRGEERRIKGIQFNGITLPGQAQRMANFVLNQQKYNREKIQFETDIRALSSEVGDRITVSIPSFTGGKGAQILSSNTQSNGTSIVVSCDLDFENEINGQNVRIQRAEDDVIIDTTLNHSSGKILQGQKVFLNGGDLGDLKDAYVVFGSLKATNSDFIIDKITTTSKVERKIYATNYDERVYQISNYSNNSSENPPGPPNNPGILSAWATATDGGVELTRSGGSRGTVEIDERKILLSDGQAKTQFFVNWLPPTVDYLTAPDTTTFGTGNRGTSLLDTRTLGLPQRQLTTDISKYQIWIREYNRETTNKDDGENHASTGENRPWQILGETVEEFFTFEDLEKEKEYQISVVPMSRFGGAVNPDNGAKKNFTTTDGSFDVAIAKPPIPSGRIRNTGFSNPVIELEDGTSDDAGRTSDTSQTRHYGSDTLPDYWEARTGSSWIAGKVIQRSRNSSFELTNLPQGHSCTVLVRARSKAGEWSPDALSLTNSTSVQKSFSVASSATQAGASFAGTKANDGVSSTPAVPVGQTYLRFFGSAGTSTYVSTSVDGGALAGSEVRSISVFPDITHIDEAYLLNVSDTFDSKTVQSRTFEGDLYSHGTTVKTYYQESANNSDWGDEVEFSGPFQTSSRYVRIKIEVTRTNASAEVFLNDLNIKVLNDQ